MMINLMKFALNAKSEFKFCKICRINPQVKYNCSKCDTCMIY